MNKNGNEFFTPRHSGRYPWTNSSDPNIKDNTPTLQNDISEMKELVVYYAHVLESCEEPIPLTVKVVGTGVCTVLLDILSRNEVTNSCDGDSCEIKPSIDDEYIKSY